MKNASAGLQISEMKDLLSAHLPTRLATACGHNPGSRNDLDGEMET